ncbi:MAG: hypothetical protein EZS28_003333 [Streblomastix strix]|uniref:RecF/RecN/SMC N-terminal domain-containing protein n=1 Tax=Streblomastix strix TaxID=222440 RepID=A0A5J4X1E5_9EUKA|nr:MAG: hypothetical protein EZS28_003333 [Streblomastix strix]
MEGEEEKISLIQFEQSRKKISILKREEDKAGDFLNRKKIQAEEAENLLKLNWKKMRLAAIKSISSSSSQSEQTTHSFQSYSDALLTNQSTYYLQGKEEISQALLMSERKKRELIRERQSLFEEMKREIKEDEIKREKLEKKMNQQKKKDDKKQKESMELLMGNDKKKGNKRRKKGVKQNKTKQQGKKGKNKKQYDFEESDNSTDDFVDFSDQRSSEDERRKKKSKKKQDKEKKQIEQNLEDNSFDELLNEKKNNNNENNKLKKSKRKREASGNKQNDSRAKSKENSKGQKRRRINETDIGEISEDEIEEEKNIQVNNLESNDNSDAEYESEKEEENNREQQSIEQDDCEEDDINSNEIIQEDDPEMRAVIKFLRKHYGISQINSSYLAQTSFSSLNQPHSAASKEIAELQERLNDVERGIDRLEETAREGRLLVLGANRQSFIRVSREMRRLFAAIFANKDVRLVPTSWLEEESQQEGRKEANDQEGKQDNKEQIQKQNNDDESIQESLEEIDDENEEQLLQGDGINEDQENINKFKSFFSSSEKHFGEKMKDKHMFSFDGGLIVQIRDRHPKEGIDNENDLNKGGGINLQWRDGLTELSGGQKTLLSICFLVAVSKLGMGKKNIDGKDHTDKEGKNEKAKEIDGNNQNKDFDETLCAKRQALILFDEIDSALDERNQALLARLISCSFSWAQMVMVSHLPGALNIADCVITLDRVKGGSEKEEEKGSRKHEIQYDSTYVAKIVKKGVGV